MRVTSRKSRVRESRLPGSVRAEPPSYSTANRLDHSSDRADPPKSTSPIASDTIKIPNPNGPQNLTKKFPFLARSLSLVDKGCVRFWTNRPHYQYSGRNYQLRCPKPPHLLRRVASSPNEFPIRGLGESGKQNCCCRPAIPKEPSDEAHHDAQNRDRGMLRRSASFGPVWEPCPMPPGFARLATIPSRSGGRNPVVLTTPLATAGDWNRRPSLLFEGTLEMPTQRWSPQRKTALLLAIDYDLITAEDALDRFALSSDELASWRLKVGAAGLPAMRSTRLQLFPECR